MEGTRDKLTAAQRPDAAKRLTNDNRAAVNTEAANISHLSSGF
jgi:hypothetical protein